ncbi:hypothetical protein AB1Y20_001161 [Prymnesium parvum]|uniref:DOT1 domain-containing protein n=1 Tax=Prymnesium parvum TaxID=97485 RepID=A0AB34KB64_PRYPA
MLITLCATSVSAGWLPTRPYAATPPAKALGTSTSRAGVCLQCAEPLPFTDTLARIAAVAADNPSQRAAIASLFPPAELPLRNAASRTDGYWAFIAKKEEPPQGLTYGEFPLGFFSVLVDRAAVVAGFGVEREDRTFADLGSGAGRLVIWAAATHAWKLCRGVELLPKLHATAVAKLEDAQQIPDLLRSPVAFDEGSWDDEGLGLSQVDVAFIYTTAIPADEEGVLQDLTKSLTPQLRRGCVVCTTDYTLGVGFELVESLEGPNDGAGGVSTGYIHVKTSPGNGDEDNAKKEAVVQSFEDMEADLLKELGG